MGRTAVEQWCYALDAAFEGREHALLDNLASVDETSWRALPEGAARAIADIVLHVGDCKYVYENHLFGDRSMRWDRPGTIPPVDLDGPRDAVIAWLREGHHRIIASLNALPDDAELLTPRWANWDARYETRWLINVLLQHDLYHAGEINHLRAQLQHNDPWPWDQPEETGQGN